jgi:hypothetical protein
MIHPNQTSWRPFSLFFKPRIMSRRGFLEFLAQNFSFSEADR